MSKPLLLDTDVMVDFLRGHARAVVLVKGHSERIVLSTVVVAELYAGVKGEDEEAILDELIGTFRAVPVTVEVAKTAGIHKRNFGKSHGVGLADAILAATAQVEGAELKTLNGKHYPMFRALQPAYDK